MPQTKQQVLKSAVNKATPTPKPVVAKPMPAKPASQVPPRAKPVEMPAPSFGTPKRTMPIDPGFNMNGKRPTPRPLPIPSFGIPKRTAPIDPGFSIDGNKGKPEKGFAPEILNRGQRLPGGGTERNYDFDPGFDSAPHKSSPPVAPITTMPIRTRPGRVTDFRNKLPNPDTTPYNR